MKCAYCEARKGKRACPALGRICSRCCGKHREREIDCPVDCRFLVAVSDSSGEHVFDLIAELHQFAGGLEPEWLNGAARVFLGAADNMSPNEIPNYASFLAFGHVDVSGRRAIDLFESRFGGDLNPETERSFTELREVWASVLTVTGKSRGTDLHLLDRITGETVIARERKRPVPRPAFRVGDHLLAWAVPHDRICLLAGPGYPIATRHLEPVQAAFERALVDPVTKSESRQSVRTGRALVAAHHALRHEAQRVDEKLSQAAEDVQSKLRRAVFEIKDPDLVRGLLEEHAEFEKVEPHTFVWRGPRERTTRGRIGVREVGLTLETASPSDLEAGKQILSRLLRGHAWHCVDTLLDGLGAETITSVRERARSGIEGDIGTRVDEEVESFRQELEALIQASILESEAPKYRPGARRSRRESVVTGGHHRLPSLAHEAVFRFDPALKHMVDFAVKRLQPDPREIVSVLGPDAAARLPEMEVYLDWIVDQGRLQGWSKSQINAEVTNMFAHALCYLNFILQRRKTFWIDEDLAWMLLETDLDISGSCLQLPFPSYSLVFTDETTLELGESLLEQIGSCAIRRERLEIITIYFTELPLEVPGTRSIEATITFDSHQGKWPYILARSLCVRENDDLSGILNSRCPDAKPGGDPVFYLPELKKLVHLAINATLYSTTAHLDPAVLEPSTSSQPRRIGAAQTPISWSSEEVFHLPGKLSISTVRGYRKLQRSGRGRTILKRFMVRGHWRRANPNWKKKHIRWIEPHWRGPDIATIIERDYRLAP